MKQATDGIVVPTSLTYRLHGSIKLVQTLLSPDIDLAVKEHRTAFKAEMHKIADYWHLSPASPHIIQPTPG